MIPRWSTVRRLREDAKAKGSWFRLVNGVEIFLEAKLYLWQKDVHENEINLFAEEPNSSHFHAHDVVRSEHVHGRDDRGCLQCDDQAEMKQMH